MIVPGFLKLPTYAFELSDLSYKYLYLKEAKGGIVVEDFGEGEIAAGIIERGEIKNEDALIPLIAELVSKKNMQFVAVGLPEEKGFIRNVKLPGVKEEEAREALALQLEEYIPLPPAEVTFDYAVADRESDHLDIALNAFPSNLVESYLNAFSRAGALPILAEHELGALTRAVIREGETSTIMIIDWGKTRTSLGIAQKGILRFASSIPIGGRALDEAISKSLNMEVGAAEKLKKTRGFAKNPQTKESAAIFQAIVPIVTAIKEEAGKYVRFWQTHSEHAESPARILVSGGDANLLGLHNFLEEELDIPVSFANPWINVPFPPFYLPEIERQESIRFAPSIGLALKALEEAGSF